MIVTILWVIHKAFVTMFDDSTRLADTRALMATILRIKLIRILDRFGAFDAAVAAMRILFHLLVFPQGHIFTAAQYASTTMPMLATESMVLVCRLVAVFIATSNSIVVTIPT